MYNLASFNILFVMLLKSSIIINYKFEAMIKPLKKLIKG